MTISASIRGIRGAQGRFASMANRGLVELQLARAEELAGEVKSVFSRNAPRAKESTRPDGERFANSFHASAVESGHGFELGVTTDQPQLAKWIRDGTPPHPIVARNARALHFQVEGGDVFAVSVQHPGTSANDWEQRAGAEATSLLRFYGNRIGAEVTHRLAGKGTGD